jgi:hypothetical protein
MEELFEPSTGKTLRTVGLCVMHNRHKVRVVVNCKLPIKDYDHHLQQVKDHYTKLGPGFRMWRAATEVRKKVMTSDIVELMFRPSYRETDEEFEESIRIYATGYLKMVQAFVESYGPNALMIDIRANARGAKRYLNIAEEEGVQIPAIKFGLISRWANWHEPLQGDEARHPLTEMEMQRIKQAISDMCGGEFHVLQQNVASYSPIYAEQKFAKNSEYRVNILDPNVSDIINSSGNNESSDH